MFKINGVYSYVLQSASVSSLLGYCNIMRICEMICCVSFFIVIGNFLLFAGNDQRKYGYGLQNN